MRIADLKDVSPHVTVLYSCITHPRRDPPPASGLHTLTTQVEVLTVLFSAANVKDLWMVASWSVDLAPPGQVGWGCCSRAAVCLYEIQQSIGGSLTPKLSGFFTLFGKNKLWWKHFLLWVSLLISDWISCRTHYSILSDLSLFPFLFFDLKKTVRLRTLRSLHLQTKSIKNALSLTNAP